MQYERLLNLGFALT